MWRVVNNKFRTAVTSEEEKGGCDEDDTQEASGECVMSYLFILVSQMLIILWSMPFLVAHLPHFIIKKCFNFVF